MKYYLVPVLLALIAYALGDQLMLLMLRALNLDSGIWHVSRLFVGLLFSMLTFKIYKKLC